MDEQEAVDLLQDLSCDIEEDQHEHLLAGGQELGAACDEGQEVRHEQLLAGGQELGEGSNHEVQEAEHEQQQTIFKLYMIIA